MTEERPPPTPPPRPRWYEDPVKAGLIVAAIFALVAIARILMSR